MRALRASAAALLVLSFALATGCGVDAGDALLPYEKPDPPATAGGQCMPAVDPGPTVDPWWLEDYCPAVAEPAVIAANDLMPTITNAHALPPAGSHWDWDGMEAACRKMAAALPAIDAAADRAPEGTEEMVALSRVYVTELEAFTEECIEASADRDHPRMKAATHHLTDAADIGEELLSASFAALTAQRDGD